MMKKALVVIAVGFVACAVQAQTETISFTNYIPQTLTDWSTNVTLQQFNPSLGTLQSAVVQLDSTLTTTLVVTNTGASVVTNGHASTEVQISLAPNSFGNLTDGNNPVVDYTSPNFNFSNLAVGVSTNGTETKSSGWISSGSITDSGVLSSLTGNSDYLLGASTVTYTSISYNSGNAGVSQVTDAGLESIITYTYTVPEPSTFAMIGSGLAGLGFVLRRRNS